MVRIKGILAGQTGGLQVCMLVSLMIIGAVLSSTFTVAVLKLFYDPAVNIYQDAGALRWIQLFSSLGTFLFPAVVMAWLCSPNAKEYLYLNQKTDGNVVILVFLSMFLITPLISLTGVLNKEMVLPSFLEPLETWMKSQEELAEQLTNLFLAGDGISAFLANLLVMAIIAAITEEFLFRGVLSRVFEKWTRNPHIAIWCIAILFSAFHLQFYGFIPRMLLGAYFGYLLYWSKNIWIPVVAHLANNAYSIIGMSNSQWKDSEFVTGDISTEHLAGFSVAALISTALFIICVRLIRKRVVQTKV